MIIKTLTLSLLLLLLSGCTSKDIYESLQADRSSCIKVPEQQRQECNENIRNQKTYDEYNKERKKL